MRNNILLLNKSQIVMKCPKCNKEVSCEWNMCPHCGYKPVKCSNPSCNAGWLTEDARFCPVCGSKVIGGERKQINRIHPILYFLISLMICGCILFFFGWIVNIGDEGSDAIFSWALCFPLWILLLIGAVILIRFAKRKKEQIQDNR